MKTSKEKLAALRAAMKEQGVDAYIIPRADEYQGEFVAPADECLKWLTGFTGSAGVAIILADKAVVMSDGRYTLQLEQQVDLECFETADSTKTKPEMWLAENLTGQQVLGYDAMLHTPRQLEVFEKKNIDLKAVSQNLIHQIWADRPERKQGKVIIFDERIAGQVIENKVKVITDEISTQDATACLITLPDSIAWILNIRGQDIDYIPSVQSRLLISKGGHIQWFVEAEKIDDKVKASMPEILKIRAPDDLVKELGAIEGDVLTDFRYTPVAFIEAIKNPVDAKDPSIAPKAVKTASEIEAIRAAHVLDGVAYAKFLYWLETHKGAIAEVDIADKLLEFRDEHPAHKGLSFPTIAGFGANGAIIHYRASEETNATLADGNMVLVDSGGQYYDPENGVAGTTDITRTIAIGDPSPEMREAYTRVLKGHIGLASAQFPKTATGAQVDVFARAPLWEAGLDYAHGTGHGVGCFLAVHEEAASLSPRGTHPVVPGMLISNEPGYYKEGAFGIRLENLVLCNLRKNGMQGFETIGYAPFDKKLIITDWLSEKELAWLKSYNECLEQLIAEKLSGVLKDWYLQQLSF